MMVNEMMSRMLRWVGVSLIGLTLVFSGEARAVKIEQKLLLQTGKAAVEEIFLTWRLGDPVGRLFRLDVKRGKEERQFVFNGRVFYVCARLEEGAIQGVSSVAALDALIRDRLKQGACQELSSDFRLRFMLAPWDVIGWVEPGTVFRAAVTVEELTLENTGVTAEVAGKKCAQVKRVIRYGDRERKDAQTISNDQICFLENLPWREALAREVNLGLIRGGGKSSADKIKADLSGISGIPLRVKGVLDTFGGKAGKVTRQFALETSLVSSDAVSSEDIGIPVGCEVIDLAGLAQKAKDSAEGSKALAPIAETTSSVLDAIARTLMMGITPAAAVAPMIAPGEGGSGKAPADPSSRKK
jgi:hypothetical protein